jgi:diketogulonate reductase-like aldo/keto reductase
MANEVPYYTLDEDGNSELIVSGNEAYIDDDDLRELLIELLGDKVISGIAKDHGVSSAQVILRWNLQKGVVVIPGSSNPDHIKENLDLFGFELTDEEMNRIKKLERNEKHEWY